MTAESSLPSFIAEQLPELDAELASAEVDLTMRPFRAALDFARYCVLEIRNGDTQWTPDMDSPQFVKEPWFRAIYEETEEWYSSRYGSAIKNAPPRTVKGFALIWGTPFALKVPLTLIRPGKLGKTVWVRFPDSVLDTENPTDWLVAPPNLGALSAMELEEVTSECKEIASLLRSIMVKLIGIRPETSTAQGFLQGVQLHIELAAEHTAREQHAGGISRAYWEVQMACECAYKALLQQKSGSFPETHDLFTLHDQAILHGLHLKREVLKKFPRPKEVVGLRYGQADAAIAGFYEVYLTMLRVVDAVLAPIVTLGLGKASVEIAKAPWLPD